MTVEEIKLEALKLMFASGEAIGNDYQEAYNTGLYTDYFDKMDGSIKRALSRIAQSKKTFPKVNEFMSKDLDLEDCEIKFELPINTINIERFQFKDLSRKTIRDVDYYQIAKNKATVENNQDFRNGKFIIYTHDIPTVDELREDVAALIPLYIKSELYEEDEYQMALQARNMFEQGLALIDMNTTTTQSQVENIFGRY